MLLFDRVAIVTGGAQGTGRAIVERLSREGAKVIIADIADSEGGVLAGAITATGREAVYRHVNVATRLDVHNLVTVATETYGHIDILVNNAGTIDDVAFLELDEPEFDRVLQTNLKGTFLVTQAVARQMVRQRRDDPDRGPGAIVNVSSINARYGLGDNVAYAVSKGGQISLTKSMAVALAPENIRVNAVGVGAIESDGSEALLHNKYGVEATLAQTPLGRLGTSEEIAAAVVWLASEEASYLTGTTLWADGGRIATGVVNDRTNSKS
ncbi:MAG: SDR family NAD(P)-dependent oxidoreductase [Hyphomicrobiaceae bacterium]